MFAPSARDRIRSRLVRLGQHELCLVLVLLAARSVLRPYMGIEHDARLYTVQVLHKLEPETYAGDLFLAYGSQDSYSFFGGLVAPLASTLGLTTAFFLLYLVFVALLVWAEVRLVRRLIPDPLVAMLSLILLTVTDVPYGGNGIFHAHEVFFSARLPAQVLVLLGLDQLLRGRYGRTVLTMAAALAIHPLMAFGGACLAFAWWATKTLRPRSWICGGALALAALAVPLVVRPVGDSLFRSFTDAWFDISYRVSPHCFVSTWTLQDWLRLAGCIGTLLVAARVLPRDTARLSLLAAGLAAASVVVTAAGEQSRYLLLVQGQAYRGLWLAQLLSVPIGLFAAHRMWQPWSLVSRGTALMLLVYVWEPFAMVGLAPELAVTGVRLAAAQMLIWGVLLRAWKRSMPTRDWIINTLGLTLISTSISMTIHNLFVFGDVLWRSSLDVTAVWWILPHACSALAVGLLGLLIISLIYSAARQPGWRMAALASVVWLAASAGIFLYREHPFYLNEHAPGHSDLAFVRDYIRSSRPGEKHPQLYWPIDPRFIWIDLSATSYYSWTQVQGVVFSAETAAEGTRRSALARRFEIAEFRSIPGSNEDMWQRMLTFLQTDFNCPAPTQQDLLTLASEPQLDFIVIKQRFDGLYSATNGSVYIYDCRKLNELAATE